MKLFYTGVVFQLITAPIHLIGHFIKPVPANDQEKLLLELMANVRQDFGGGFVRSMRDMVSGLSLQYSIMILMIGCMNLLAARSVKDARFIRSLAWLNFAFMSLCGLNAYVHFFIPPLTLFVLPAMAFLIAAVASPGTS